MAKTIRVGIIGASANSGWARDSHVPALKDLSGLTLVAVATNSQATADRAAAAFGVAKAYPDGLALIADRDIDLVTVATRVPDHRDLVLAALRAGKHVYCEWPLGRSADEAEEMAQAARAAGVQTVIGLQFRASPTLLRARELISSGAIGRLLSISTYSSTAGFGPDVPAPFVYLEDPANFANLVTIQGAHTIDLALALIGPLDDLSALATAQYPTICKGEVRMPSVRTTFDHLLVQARATHGGSLIVEVAGGRAPVSPFWLEAVGTEGTLRLEGGAPRGLQSGRAKLFFEGAEEPIDEGELAGLSEAASNVAGAYASLRDDIARGSCKTVGFEHAVRLTRLVEDVLQSSVEGRRLAADGWPLG